MPGLLDGFMDDPSTMGLLGLAGGLLSAGGPSLVPHSLGQGLGAGLQGMQQGYNGTTQRLAEQQANAQQMQMNGLKIDGLKQQQAQQALSLAMQNRIKQRLMGGQGADQPALAGSPLQDTPASAMPGGPMSPKTGGPDWLQAYQQSQPAPMAQAAPQMPQAGAQPQMGGADALGPQVAARLLREAKIRSEEGDDDGANKLYEQATKYMPKFATEFRQAVGPDGKLRNYQMADNGQIKEVGLGVKPDMTEVDLGGSKRFVDKNSVTSGQEFKRTQTPDSIASNSLGYARLNFDKAQAEAENAPDTTTDAEKKLWLHTYTANNGQIPRSAPPSVRKYIGTWAAEMGITPNDLSSGAAKAKFDQAMAVTAGHRGGAMASVEATMPALVENAQDLSHKLGQGKFVPLNKLVQMSNESISDPTLAAFKVAHMAVVSEYQQVISRGGTNVTALNEAMHVLNGARSVEAYDAAMNMVKKEVAINVAGTKAVRGGMGGGDHGPAPAAAPAGGKTVSLSDIQATATASGKTTKQVTDALKAKGYTIGGM